MSHLYKKFVEERVSPLVNNIENIRNCTVIAHIDHGKTTLTDSLIAASGLLSKDVAASAKLLDYDMIEQERGITIKSSGISLIHDREDQEYLIHLVDTPGHIDFSSHVTRGLRLTDGAIVVVDVIEGVMVQTETVTRQAIEEVVRPMLFLNKIDRLITERKLNAEQVAEQIKRVVMEFNGMLGKYIDDDLLDKWQVSFARNSLCVGSALDKWGIGIEVLRSRAGESADRETMEEAFLELLKEIVEAYRNENEDELSKRYPVAETTLDSVVHIVPNPKEAQKERMPRIWGGQSDTEYGKSLYDCNRDGPCILAVSNTQRDRHAGLVAVVRVFSGILRNRQELTNLRTGDTEKTLLTGLLMSKTRVGLDEVPAGNLAFLTGIEPLSIGDTLVEPGYEDAQPISELQYPTEPVVTYTIEPKILSQLSEIKEPIKEFVETDPALEFQVNPETGEMLLSGAGELHVEISVEKLERKGVQVRLGQPMVLLKEQLTEDGKPESAGGAESSSFTVQAKLLQESGRPDIEGEILDADPQSMCYLVDQTKKIEPHTEEAEWVIEGFRTVKQSGPVQGERMRHLLVVIREADIRFEKPETSWRDITQPMIQALRKSIMSDEPVVLEPWLHLEITAPEDYIGTLSKILAKRKGEILEMESERHLYKIEAEIPVRESFGLADEMRTATSGWATWGAESGDYRRI
ncbi:MAG: GTP-binding protein [Candidatus Lokiarchaeota archaeon]|nr:GTP-binding protein [Candidatus Lokiarchaeota archaeon]